MEASLGGPSQATTGGISDYSRPNVLYTDFDDVPVESHSHNNTNTYGIESPVDRRNVEEETNVDKSDKNFYHVLSRSTLDSKQ